MSRIEMIENIDLLSKNSTYLENESQILTVDDKSDNVEELLYLIVKIPMNSKKKKLLYKCDGTIKRR